MQNLVTSLFFTHSSVLLRVKSHIEAAPTWLFVNNAVAKRIVKEHLLALATAVPVVISHRSAS
jgi:hypothetical protein